MKKRRAPQTAGARAASDAAESAPLTSWRADDLYAAAHMTATDDLVFRGYATRSWSMKRTLRRLPVYQRLHLLCTWLFARVFTVCKHLFAVLYVVIDLLRRLLCLPDFVMSRYFWYICAGSVLTAAMASFAASLLAMHAFSVDAIPKHEAMTYSAYAVIPSDRFTLGLVGKVAHVAVDNLIESSILPFVFLLCILAPVGMWSCVRCCCPCIAIPIEHVASALISWSKAIFSGSDSRRPAAVRRKRRFSRTGTRQQDSGTDSEHDDDDDDDDDDRPRRT